MTDIFPIQTTLFFHGSKEDRHEEVYALQQNLGTEFDEDFIGEYVYAGYEVAVKVKINQNGKVYATHLNGVKLERAIQI